MKRNLLQSLALLIFVLFFQLTNAYAQNNQVNDSIYSDILKEERSVKVFLPETYKPGSAEKYEVIYLTDGEWAMDLFSYIYKFAKGENYVPPVIIVALPNTYINKVNQRDRDFLPVHVENPVISGGGDKFISFLKNELIPYIDKTYPTNGTNSLYGHSYGGLFVMYTLLTEHQLFQSYYSTDPSFWWNNDFVIKLASERLEKLPGDRLLWIAGIDETYKGMGIGRMDSVLKLKASKNLRWKIATFPNEKHNSVRLKAMYDGIKFSYSGYSAAAIQFHPMNGILLKDKPSTIFLLDRFPEMRYTLDGTEPDRTSPKADSRILINGPAQLVLKSFSASGKYDLVAKGSFTPGDILPSSQKPKRFINGGLKYACYGGSWDKMPDFKKLKPLQTGVADSLFSFKNLPLKADFACCFEGYIEIKDEGYYIFAAVTKNASRLYLGNKLLIDGDAIHSSETTQSFVIPLEKGFYPVRLEYFQKDASPSLQLLYLKPGAGDPTSIPFKCQYH
ncbi:MAG: alpha/beta hydrolase-fold protein [Bacteroidales bacterium]